MRNPLTWLFGYSDSPNPDIVGIVRIPAEEIDYDILEREELKLRAAKEYIRARGIKPKPTYIAKPQTEEA